ncbi:hypothetical protein SSS_02308 [Sarcoptes scabiei]|uniref:Uncharacterized protein n=1 Tax=Sarcoptes scabiei TaxID=52283 RepID=A0A834VCS0_SARSC|nr:hypothetical protein SSS_02308 [Sarcoptes scabiei]
MMAIIVELLRRFILMILTFFYRLRVSKPKSKEINLASSSDSSWINSILSKFIQYEQILLPPENPFGKTLTEMSTRLIFPYKNVSKVFERDYRVDPKRINEIIVRIIWLNSANLVRGLMNTIYAGQDRFEPWIEGTLFIPYFVHDGNSRLFSIFVMFLITCGNLIDILWLYSFNRRQNVPYVLDPIIDFYDKYNRLTTKLLKIDSEQKRMNVNDWHSTKSFAKLSLRLYFVIQFCNLILIAFNIVVWLYFFYDLFDGYGDTKLISSVAFIARRIAFDFLFSIQILHVLMFGAGFVQIFIIVIGWFSIRYEKIIRNNCNSRRWIEKLSTRNYRKHLNAIKNNQRLRLLRALNEINNHAMHFSRQLSAAVFIFYTFFLFNLDLMIYISIDSVTQFFLRFVVLSILLVTSLIALALYLLWSNLNKCAKKALPTLHFFIHDVTILRNDNDDYDDDGDRIEFSNKLLRPI